MEHQYVMRGKNVMIVETQKAHGSSPGIIFSLVLQPEQDWTTRSSCCSQRKFIKVSKIIRYEIICSLVKMEQEKPPKQTTLYQK